MKDRQTSVEAGKRDAEQFIKNELIDYDPFVAVSDLHLVRKTVPISYDSFRKTIEDKDVQLWSSIDRSARKIAAEQQDSFDFDGYAAGFSEGVAAVWEKIRDDVR